MPMAYQLPQADSAVNTQQEPPLEILRAGIESESEKSNAKR